MMQARDMIAKLSKLSTEVSNIDEELNYLVAHRLMLDRVKRRLTKSIEDSEVQTENLQASKSQLYDG